ncbi:hypothetical protein BC939DRAFT_435564 [Gamsiella multidivaricata]|uniref:uncharacterized protein n=1 Tax=Gamsiella multidivaricata TaxID=101098 RepID=UPI00222050A5|nr:uncharacterized protein BC939DRAFT_435564 [Gamsiella multidivaricata]KAG0350736.1 hypothetical protein BGZ54_003664 [Gamsiella multidivaricata]KAI7832462.1 hypothetical protein BC939DRAFT_435564 [Gamsiella multidivaricata]
MVPSLYILATVSLASAFVATVTATATASTMSTTAGGVIHDSPQVMHPMSPRLRRTSPPQGPVSGWPSSLDIEVDKLEIGGLSIPSLQSIIRNSEIGAKNFGNVAAEEGLLASGGVWHGVGQVVE